MMARRLFLIGFAVALLAAFGCSGDDGGTSTPGIACSDGGDASPNAVAMSCGGTTDGTTEEVDVVMGGPASGSPTKLLGMNFDVTYDPLKLEFVPAESYPSAVFTEALPAVTLLDGQPGRVVVSIQQVGGVLVSVGPGQHVVLKLYFRRAGGATFGPTALDFDLGKSEATSASTAIGFENGLALSY